MTTRVIRGDARAGLRLLAEDSVHCVKTSPPYYGLRAYECEETIWGGDEACAHQWGEPVRAPWANDVPGPGGREGKNGYGARNETKFTGPFCSICGAWRGALGLEPDWRDYLDHLVEVFREVRRVLRDDGVLFLNMGDSYASGAGSVGEHPGGGAQGERWRTAPSRGLPTDRLVNGRGDQPAVQRMKTRATRDGTNAGKSAYRFATNTVPPKAATGLASMGPMTQPNRMPQPGLKPKDRMLMPERLAIALQEDGWWVRDVIVWNKPNPMPSSVEDRTTPAHEMVYVLTKRAHYWWDGEAIKEPFAESSIARLTQPNVEEQCGGARQDLFESLGAKPTAVRRPNEIARGLSQRITRKPQGWDVGPGSHSTIEHNKCGNGVQRYAGHQENESLWEGTGRNKRSVWTTATEPFGGGFCTACRIYYEGGDLRALRVEEIKHEDGRKERRRHCSCGRWDAWLSHFATFPTKLVEPCLLAACPERCCSSCGRGWRRVVETIYENPGNRTTNGPRSLKQRHESPGFEVRLEKNVQTLGWEPDCGCGASARPGVILDPFGGAGTVAVVAQRNGRDAVLIELSRDYSEMARQRLVGEQPLFACVEVEDLAERRVAEVGAREETREAAE